METIIIPFNSMPNVCEKLDTEDYLKVIHDEKGIFEGFVQVIHLNEKYSEWHNIRYYDMSKDNIFIFTGECWEKHTFADIHEQLNKEVTECLLYLKEHYEYITKKIEK